MLDRLTPAAAPACVWMRAGVLTYKLCDREFDCEHCPLDAALHGYRPGLALRRGPPPERGGPRATFPDDRLYSGGHTWIQPPAGGHGRTRFGIDRFAASLLACPRRVRPRASPGCLRAGDALCDLDLDPGTVCLAAPIAARVGRWNRRIEDDPAALLDEPYGGGWIVELRLAEDGELDRLLDADDARRQARLDARRFRRRLALELLAEDRDSGLGRSQDPGPLTADLRHLLGGASYLALLQDLVH